MQDNDKNNETIKRIQTLIEEGDIKLDLKINDLSENLNPKKIYKITDEDLEQGKKPEFDNFLDIMNFALTRPFETIT